MNKDQVKEKLFSKKESDYGDKYRDHLLEQYKLYIESAEKISDRRHKANDFFVGLNTALVAFLGYAYNSSQTDADLIFIFAPLGGFTICYLWYRMILSYKGLNGGKFDVAHLIEDELPLKLYDAEWDILGRGNEPKKYQPFTNIELKIPWVFIIIYTLIFLVPFIN